MTKLEHLPKPTADTLDAHERNIRTYLKAETKGVRQWLAYKYLLGREMLLAKDRIPHGNSDNGNAANQGFKSWLQARFSKLDYRVCARRMEFARAVHAAKEGAALAQFTGKPNVSFLAAIEVAMPAVLDGKSASQFLRDHRLLRDLQKPKPVPRKKLDPNQLLTAKQKQAARLWTGIISDVSLGLKLRQHLNDQLRADILDCLVSASTQFRADKGKKMEARI